jgi:hypothetical protein
MNMHNMTLDELTDTIDRYSGGDPDARWAGYELAGRVRSLTRTNTDLLNIVRRLSDMAPSSEGLGGHAPLMAFTELAIQARRVLDGVKP